MKLPGVLKPLSSLRLTVVCLCLGMLLIFAGTLDQVHLGIHAVQKKYFQSFIAVWQIPGLAIGNFHYGFLVLPGGYLLGSVLLVNLVAAHLSRFKLTWKKAGIFLVHIGIILLLLGELFTGLFAEESQMVMDEGETLWFSEADRKVELAIADISDSPKESVVAIPEWMLAKKDVIEHPDLPFDIHIRKFMANSDLYLRAQNPDIEPSGATTGLGVHFGVAEKPRTGKPNERDITTILAELKSGDESLGTWLLSNGIVEDQTFAAGEKNYRISVRRVRDYKSFSLKLLDFTHDRYAGTNIPMNFSSSLELTHPDRNEQRKVLIYMNNPLRYEGYTFYQSGFDNDDTTSIIAVVRNPTWLLPYVACALVALGLVVQFGMHLFRFGSRRMKASQAS